MSRLEREADVVAAIDRRLGAGRVARKALRYVFPDHWSFMLGEIALYAFLVLVATGVYLALFFSPDVSGTVVYHGPFAALQGAEMTQRLPLDARPLLDRPRRACSCARPTTGPRSSSSPRWSCTCCACSSPPPTGARASSPGCWASGCWRRACSRASPATRCPTTCSAGWAWPSPTASRCRSRCSAARSARSSGAAQFPGPGVIESRLYILHVFVLPAVMAALIAAHLALVVRHKHTQFAGPGRREDNVVGTPMWPGYALRSLGLLFAVAAVLVLLGGLVQVNPVWQWGPYELDRATNGAQPDWYLGWLIGGLRLMPPLRSRSSATRSCPTPSGAASPSPGVVFTMLAAWPFLEPRLLRDRARHDLLDRPRDHPWRTAFGVGLLQLGGADLRGRRRRPALLPVRHLLHEPGPPLPRADADRAARRLRGREDHLRRAAPHAGQARAGRAGTARAPPRGRAASTSSATGGDETAACHRRGSGRRGASAHRCLGDL